jgi:hexokinase
MDININLNITLSPSKEVPPWVDKILSQLGLIIEKENQIMTAQTDALDQAEAAVASQDKADASAETLLLQLVALYNDAVLASTDPAVTQRINALGSAVTARAARLSAAVVANTPAAATP